MTAPAIENALSVDDPKTAVWWLLSRLSEQEISDILDHSKKLPHVAALCLDVFWITAAQLRQMIRKQRSEVSV